MKTDNEKELPKRKPTRLKNFDYSFAGAYIVTICNRDRMQILSEVKTDLMAADKTIGCAVGEGLCPVTAVVFKNVMPILLLLNRLDKSEFDGE